jgi:outer membrane protein insertion porin family
LAISQIQRLYVEKGYDRASVTLVEGGNTGDTKVVIEIFEGPKVTVTSISFEGNHFASDSQLRIEIGTREPRMVDGYRQKLIAYYQSQGFFEVKVTPVTRPGADPSNVDLTFVVAEGTWYKVRDVIIEGNTKLKTEKLREDLELHSGEPFVMAVREADKNRMLIKYGEIGCLDTQIACEPRFTDELDVVDLIYKINERIKDRLIPHQWVMARLLRSNLLEKKRINILNRGPMGRGDFMIDTNQNDPRAELRMCTHPTRRTGQTFTPAPQLLPAERSPPA